MFHNLDSFSMVFLIKLEVIKKPCITLKGLRRPNKLEHFFFVRIEFIAMNDFNF